MKENYVVINGHTFVDACFWNFDGTHVFFCSSEEDAKRFLMVPGDTVVCQDYNPYLPVHMREYTPVKRRDISQIRVDYSPTKVVQMNVSEWKRHLGLLPKRKKEPYERAMCIEALASCMMKNGVR